MCEDASAERVQAQVPDGHDGRMLQDVCAVQEQENAPVRE